jgi:CheY-like chemotaxis protein
VAKILVADDNSNVQKTVALALADLGVEVVAVNNGEAAVRKLADVSPDLVLADIFMPVRNGYEVCEYVKKDSRFSHVPVVLLVGAFDPLDEREAQRVGADGILKKPFVPPDPLITMVKTLLDRVLGDRLVAVAVSKPAVSMQGKAGGIATAEEHPSAREASNEIPLEEFRPPADRVSFGEAGRPIAFGQLLDSLAKDSAAQGSGAVEPVDNEQILTSSRDASLGDPIFWRTEEPQPETEEENSEPEGDISSGLPMRAWKPDEEAMSRAEAEFLQPVEPFELVREEKDQEAVETPTVVEQSPSIVQDAAAQASLTVDAAKSEDLAANPIEWMASVPPPPAEEIPVSAADWSAEVPEAAEKLNRTEADNLKPALEPVEPESSAGVETPASASVPTPEPPPLPTPVQPSMKPLAQSAEDTARSILKQDWADLAASLQDKPTEPEAEKAKPASASVAQPPAATATNGQTAPANSAPPDSKPLTQNAEDTARSIPKQDWADMATNLQAKPAEPVAEKAKPAPASVAQPPALPLTDARTAPANSAPRDSKPLTQNAEDTARSIPKQDWADLTANLQAKPAEPVTEKTKPAPAPVAQPAAANAQPEPANAAPPDSPDPALVEAVVQRVLEKMRPQVVDIITKEFLRPVVQALVHREIQKR